MLQASKGKMEHLYACLHLSPISFFHISQLKGSIKSQNIYNLTEQLLDLQPLYGYIFFEELACHEWIENILKLIY